MAGITKKEVLPRWVRTIVIGRHPKWTIIRIVTLVIIVALLYLFVFAGVRVKGISMEPTFRNGKIYVLYRLAYTWSKPERGDVVGVRWAGSESILLLKRIVALPGETIAWSNGRLLINGKVLNEPYLAYTCDWDMSPRTMGQDDYFIVGDNRQMPFESHTKRACHISDLIGRVICGGKATPTLSTN